MLSPVPSRAASTPPLPSLPPPMPPAQSQLDLVTLGSGEAPPPGGHVGVHGMIVVGNDHISHIPMFHAPHDYQAVMEVSLRHPQLPPEQNLGRELFTLEPEPFSLGDLLQGRLTRFQGTLYRGSFEDGGTPLLEGVQVEVRGVRQSRHLEPGSVPAPQLDYVMYGRPGDTYLVHSIQGQPADFDQILKVDCLDSGLSEQELSQGVSVSVPSRQDRVEARLRGGESVAVELGSLHREARLAIERELSCLVGPHFTHGPTA